MNLLVRWKVGGVRVVGSVLKMGDIVEEVRSVTPFKQYWIAGIAFTGHQPSAIKDFLDSSTVNRFIV